MEISAGTGRDTGSCPHYSVRSYSHAAVGAFSGDVAATVPGITVAEVSAATLTSPKPWRQASSVGLLIICLVVGFIGGLGFGGVRPSVAKPSIDEVQEALGTSAGELV
jgi:hypothetical protein